MTEPLDTLDKLPVIGAVRRRMRLEIAPKAAVTRGPGRSLKRYRDPKTGLIYVGTSRWDPALTESVMNSLDIDVETASNERGDS